MMGRGLLGRGYWAGALEKLSSSLVLGRCGNLQVRIVSEEQSRWDERVSARNSPEGTKGCQLGTVPKGRKDVAMGDSPWSDATTNGQPRRGDRRVIFARAPVAPLGLTT